MNQEPEWSIEFLKKFGADKIWVVPSKDNVETILDIWSFIQDTIKEEKEKSYIEGFENSQNGYTGVVKKLGKERDNAAKKTINELLSKIEEEVEAIKGYSKHSLGGAAFTNSTCKGCGRGFVAPSTLGGLCHNCEEFSKKILLILSKYKVNK